MAAPTLQFKRGNAGVAGTVPALRPGEPAISLNNFDFYIGTDTTVSNNKFFGSHRYWGREDGTNSLRLKLVDKGGTNSIELKSPDTLAGITTYTFPATPISGRYLRVDANGILSWDDAGASGGNFTDATLTGITTITGSLNVSANSNITGITTFSGAINATGNVTIGDAGTDTLIVNSTTTFNGAVTGTISTATRATLIDTTETGSNLEYFPTFVSNSTTTQSQTVRTDSGISYNPSTNTITVPNIKTENLKHSNGTQAVSIDASGNVGVSSNLSIAGNLFVNGNTTSVNTETLKVKDSLIDLGKVDDGFGNLIPPTADANIDVGILFNYFDTAARKAAVYWDDSVTRIAIASRVTETNSVLTASAYAALEVGGLWVNNSCTGGASEIISCFGGSQLELRNILIDAGTF
jgi:hypothetical protein